MVVSYGEDEAKSLFGLTNNLAIFGGGKDIQFYRELSELIDDVRVSQQTVSDGPGGIGTSRSGEDVRVLRPGDIRRIREKHALVIAGNAPPIIAKLRRCFDGADGQLLRGELEAARARGTRRHARPSFAKRSGRGATMSRRGSTMSTSGGRAT